MTHKKVVLVAIATSLVILAEMHIIPSLLLPAEQKDDAIITVHEKILHVGKNYDFAYPTIEDALRNAEDGDIVLVHNGTYYENIILGSSIELVGESKENTTIDGGGKGDVVKITADGVSLSNFTVCNSGVGWNYINDAAIKILSSNTVIRSNNILLTNYGIWIQNGTHNIIENNSCTAMYDGIWLMNSKDNVLRNNSMDGCSVVLDGSSPNDFIHDIDPSNVVNGKPVYYYNNQLGITVPSDAGQVILANCKRCTVLKLDISDVTDGIEVMYSDKNIIRDNKISKTKDCGIRLFRSNENLIENNVCSDNPVGIACSSGGSWILKQSADCMDNLIQSNIFSDNDYCGILFDTSDYNTITGNNFIENNYSAIFYDSYKNKWHGNYWDDWIGAKRLLGRIFPKIIWGYKQSSLLKISRPCINIDWKPQKNPYAL